MNMGSPLLTVPLVSIRPAVKTVSETLREIGEGTKCYIHNLIVQVLNEELGRYVDL